MKTICTALLTASLVACSQPAEDLPVTFKPHIPFCGGEKLLTGVFLKPTENDWYLQTIPCDGDFAPSQNQQVTILTQPAGGAQEVGIAVVYNKATNSRLELHSFLRMTGSKMGADSIFFEPVNAQEGEEVMIAFGYLNQPR